MISILDHYYRLYNLLDNSVENLSIKSSFSNGLFKECTHISVIVCILSIPIDIP
jgi:hypothetical protein